MVPIEIGVNRGFFDYFVDDMDTYHEAFAKALRAFTQPSREGTAAGGAPLPADHSTQQAPAGGGAAAQLQPDGQSNST